MAQVLIRSLDNEVLAHIKARASRHHRSLQGELKAIITEAAQTTVDPGLLAEIDSLRENLRNKIKSSSIELLRQERDC